MKPSSLKSVMIAAAVVALAALSARPAAAAEPPMAPTNLVVWGWVNTVFLSWDAVDGAEGYVVYREYPPQTMLVTGATRYTDWDLADNTQYCYQVSAKAGGLESPRTALACATTSVRWLFKRGDADGSGAVDIGDEVALIGYASCGSKITCLDAADVDDNGFLGDMGRDQTILFEWIFYGKYMIPIPGPFDCGMDPIPDRVAGCESYDCTADGSHPATAEFELGFLEQTKTESGQLVVDCMIAHSGAGPGARGFSFGVIAEGGAISTATAIGTFSENIDNYVSSFQVTGGAGNEGALCAAVFYDHDNQGCFDLPLNAETSVARLTIDPLPGSIAVTLRYKEGLVASGSQPVKNLVSRINGDKSETFVPQMRTLTIGTCPAAGDTHCLGLQIDGPEGNVAGTYTATATVQDDSGDPVICTFTAQRGDEPPIVVGPKAGYTAAFDLGVGTWTITVDVDDDTSCTDLAVDARCSVTVTVVPAGGLAIPGDANGDGGLDISDAVATLGFLFLGSPSKLPCGDGSATDPANRKLIDWQPDSAIDISDAVATLTFLFLGGKPHTMAPEADQKGCVRIVGCPDLCGK